jgi:hypothetical protein
MAYADGFLRREIAKTGGKRTDPRTIKTRASGLKERDRQTRQTGNQLPGP